MMRVCRDIQSRAPSSHAPRVPQLPRLYTPTPYGFEALHAGVGPPAHGRRSPCNGTGARVQQTLLDATITRGVSSGGSEA